MFTKDSRHVWISSEKYSCEIILIRKCFYVFKTILKNIWININFTRGNSFLSPKNEGKRPVPLRNIGLNCYLNSSFQSIVACNHFVDEMKNLEYRYPRSKNLLVFNKILHSLCENSTDDVELSSNSILRNWNRSGEQDTFELLSFIIFQVFNELRAIQQNNLPKEERTAQNWNKEQLPLKLLIEFRMKCNCGYAFTPTLQTDLALHLSVPFRIYSNMIPFTIERLLDNYFIPENISDFPCLNSDCTNSQVTKFIILQKPMPNTLCLHIQRSFWNGISNRMEKNNERVSFQDKLILKKEFFSEYQPYYDGPLSSVCLDICKTENLFDEKIKTEIVVVKDKEKNADGDRIGINESSDLSLETSTDGAPNGSIENSPNQIKRKSGEMMSPAIDESAEMVSKCCEDKIPCEISKNFPLSCITEASNCSSDAILNCQSHDNEDDMINKDANAAGSQFGICEPVILTVNSSNIDSNTLLATINGSANPLDSINKGMDQKLGEHIDTNSATFSTIENEVYYLKSVIVHFGRAESGHYICYRKCGPKWFCTNDNFITEVSFSEVQNAQAYILMYERAH